VILLLRDSPLRASAPLASERALRTFLARLRGALPEGCILQRRSEPRTMARAAGSETKLETGLHSNSDQWRGSPSPERSFSGSNKQASSPCALLITNRDGQATLHYFRSPRREVVARRAAAAAPRGERPLLSLSDSSSVYATSYRLRATRRCVRRPVREADASCASATERATMNYRVGSEVS
jgi:hypothetical protein